MEAAGLAVGFVSLAGLFSTCVDCFKFVQVYQSRDRDYELFQTMLDNQQFHLMAWGKACGFMDPERTNARFDDPLQDARNRRIEETLDRIRNLLTNGDNLKQQYGLKVHRAPVGSKMIEGPGSSAFSKAFQSTKSFWNTSLQRKSQIAGTMRWAVDDKDKFDNLVQNLRDLVEDLTKFTDDMGVTDTQRLVVEYEMELIDDEPSLEAIAAASACDDENDDLISHAVSRRLLRVKAQSVANQPLEFDDSISLTSTRHTPSISTIPEEETGRDAQEVGITRVPLSEWRKIKTRAGTVPWLKSLVVATASSSILSEPLGDIQPLSRTNTLTTDTKPESGERAVRLAINSRKLINILRKITSYKLSVEHNVMVYPFKPLIAYETELLRYYAALREKLQQLSERRDHEKASSVESEEHDTADKATQDESTATEIEATELLAAEMQCLIQFMSNDMHQIFQIRKQMQDKSLQSIEFEHLWLIFQPGTVIVSHDPGSEKNLRAYEILHVTGGRPIIDTENHSKSESIDTPEEWKQVSQDGFAVMSSRACTDFVIDCFYMDFDGTSYGPRPHRFVISEFSGKREISTLPVCLPTEGELEYLHTRGLQFRTHTQEQRLFYSGSVLKEWEPDHRNVCSFCSRQTFNDLLNTEVIIDHTTGIEQCRNVGCSWSVSFGGGIITKATKGDKREAFETVDCAKPNCKSCTDVFNDSIIDLHLRDKFIRSSNSLKALQGKQLTEHQLTLLPYRLCGFSLHNRRWYPLHIHQVQSVANTRTGLNDLVLPDGHMSMLSALIEAQSSSQKEDEGFVDVVKGKGQGTVILLHGPSGTGKRSTAEILAAHLKRPLFLIRVADLGGTPREMEEKFTQFLHLAEKWGCILVIHEADGLVSHRRNDDREGTTIASIFMESIEYFSGILILTTNRVGAFDDGMMSRIHLSLYYPPLTFQSSMKLWENLLRRLKQRESNVRFIATEIMEFVEHQRTNTWNGREIRNSISTALALAKEEARRNRDEIINLKPRHFKAVMAASQEFTDYMRAIHTSDEGPRATRTLARTNRAPTAYSSDNWSHTSGTNFVPSSSVGMSDISSDVVSERSTLSRRMREGPRKAKQEDSDFDLEVQELEIQLQIAKLKRQQKGLKSKKKETRPSWSAAGFSSASESE